jgi:TolA-binding protein
MLALTLATVLVSCMRSDPAELLETAKFEELQQNVPHARELYERIVTQHPESAQAKEARERLAKLGAPR